MSIMVLQLVRLRDDLTETNGGKMLKAWSALAVGFWWIALSLLIGTAGAGRRDGLTVSERIVLPLARWLAKRGDESLGEKVDRLEDSHKLSPMARKFLKREDMLAQTEIYGMFLRWLPGMTLAVGAGGLLAARVARSQLGGWGDSLAMYVFVAVMTLTMLVLFWTSNPQRSRWSTWAVSSNARRAFLALIKPFGSANQESTATDPDRTDTDQDSTTFRPSQVTAVRELENLALSMERYAIQRALPDGRTPMPEVVKVYGSAALSMRALRETVEVDREDAREQALREVRRIIEVLASPGSVRGLAEPNEDALELLQQNSQRGSRRRRSLIVLLFTVVAGLLAFVLVKAGLPESAAAVIAALITIWTGHLRLPGANTSA
ncbi:hypothetical protein [Streptomyces sp. NPDC002521]